MNYFFLHLAKTTESDYLRETWIRYAVYDELGGKRARIQDIIAQVRDEGIKIPCRRIQSMLQPSPCSASTISPSTPSPSVTAP